MNTAVLLPVKSAPDIINSVIFANGVLLPIPPSNAIVLGINGVIVNMKDICPAMEIFELTFK
jgi:hypothetical protein